MKLYILAIRDIKANYWQQPFFTNHVGTAVREFGDLCAGSKPDHPFAQHPEDYELFLLGEWDDEDARFATHDDGGFVETYRKQLAVGANYRKN